MSDCETQLESMQSLLDNILTSHPDVFKSNATFFSTIRTGVRKAWSTSPMKVAYFDSKVYKVTNTNPRSLKRFPVVKKILCEMCGNEFGTTGVELDHLSGENKLTCVEDILPFISSILFVTPDDLQILCKDVKVGKVVKSFGCHSIKTYAERHGISFEKARAIKLAIQYEKAKQVEYVLQQAFGLKIDQQPKTKAARRKLLEEKLYEQSQT